MTPACLDNPTIDCRWDDDANDCPCMEPYEPEPARTVETIDPIGDLL
jgi:hypothetical protein